MKVSKLTLLVLLVFAVQIALGMTLDPLKGKTEFLAVGRPSALKIKGVGAGPKGELVFSDKEGQKIVNGAVAVDLSSFDTGISMRDQHMKNKYLEIEKYRDAKLIFENVKIPAEKVAQGGDVEVLAKLDLHGEIKEVPVTMAIENQKGVVKVQSKFKIKLTEFKIAIPSFSGITVADEVNVTAVTEGKL